MQNQEDDFLHDQNGMNPEEIVVDSRQNPASAEHPENLELHTMSTPIVKEKKARHLVVQNEHVIAVSIQDIEAGQSIELDPNQGLAPELVLDPGMIPKSLTSPKFNAHYRPWNRPAIEPDVPILADPSPEPHDRLCYPNYLQNISQWILKFGGLTFIVYYVTGTLYFIITTYDLGWAGYTMLKLECLISLLAWYWISVDGNIRQATDDIFFSVIKKMFILRIWPSSIRNWAAKLGEEENFPEMSF